MYIFKAYKYLLFMFEAIHCGILTIENVQRISLKIYYIDLHFLFLRKKHSLRVVGHAGKGRYGMTQSEISQDDKSLPGLQALVANYARMLYEDRDQFVTTLFRAVKLNKLDVLRICVK